MFCRICGHDNGDRGTGPCSRCGFDLEFQTRPLSEQRAGLGKPLDSPDRAGSHGHLETFHHKRTGFVGIFFGIVGVVACIYILASFERAQETATGLDYAEGIDVEEDIPLDSLPIRVGSDIVYTLNAAGTSAEPHTNLNLSLIPEGSTVAFIGPPSVPLKPLVTFIDQKNREGAMAKLRLEAICCWTDSTETSFTRIPLIVPPVSYPDSAVQPVVFKLIFTNEWIVGRVEEFSIEVPARLNSPGFSQFKFDSVMTQVSRRLENRELEGRPVEVIAMFSETTVLGEAVEVMQLILPAVEEKGYRGLGLKYFLLEQ